MCFIIHKDYPNALIAEKNIICYKVTDKPSLFKGCFRSLIVGFAYKFNEQYFTILKIEPNQKEIREGFHSYITIPEYLISPNLCYIECIIPKGSKYYINPTNRQYVSNSLIPIKKIEIKL